MKKNEDRSIDRKNLRESLEGVGHYEQEHVLEWIQQFISSGRWLTCDYLLQLQNAFPDYEWEEVERPSGSDSDSEKWFRESITNCDFFWPLSSSLGIVDTIWIFARKKTPATKRLSMCGSKSLMEMIRELDHSDGNLTPEQKIFMIFGDAGIISGLIPKPDV